MPPLKKGDLLIGCECRNRLRIHQRVGEQCVPAFCLVAFSAPLVAHSLALGDDAGADYNRILGECLVHTLDDEMIDAAHVFVEYERRHPGSHYAVCSEVTLIDTRDREQIRDLP